jgi:acetyltransferase-like isoleucine patch superfamily enzyme
MKNKITGLCTLLLPSFFLRAVLRLFGHEIGQNVKIGFSYISVPKLVLKENSKIGHLNIVLNSSIHMQANAKIGYMNILKGPFKLYLKEKAALGNKNYLTRAKSGISYGDSTLQLGELTKITTSHHLDLTRSIFFGDFSILAGIRSQLWTHGYYHSNQGADRVRIDGEIFIGDNVYVGSGCIFNPGVRVANAVHIGGGCTISKNLDKSGMYVNQGLRYIENDLENIRKKLTKVEGFDLVEEVYKKE